MRTPRPGLTALLAAACLCLSSPVARASDVAARERFVVDRDAAALVRALAASADPADREALGLARLAADPAIRLAKGDESNPAAFAVDALRVLDLARARPLCAAAAARAPGTQTTWLFALVDARGGQDEAATKRLLEATPVGASAFDLALLGAALPRDDRELLGAVARLALVRASALGRADRVASLAEDAVALDLAVGGRTLLIGVRALRRAGRGPEAGALLGGASAARAAAVSPSTRDDLRLEGAIAAWRQGDAAAARSAAAGARPESAWGWAHDALVRAKASPSVVPAPPYALEEAGTDGDAAALARFATVLGSAARAEDVAGRATVQGAVVGDPAFQRAWLGGLGLDVVEVAGDPAVVRDALARGLPVLHFRPHRHGDKFVDEPTLLRGYDPVTDLCVADEPEGDEIDVVPGAWLAKGRAVVGAPKARGKELAVLRAGPAAALGAAVVDLLSHLGGPGAFAAVDAYAARAPEFAGRPAFDLYLGFSTYVAALAANDEGRRAVAGSILRRSGAVPPALAFERYVRTVEGTGGVDEADAQAADLAEAVRTEGPAAYLDRARFETYARARRPVEALECLAAARALDPLDVRTLYHRSILRRQLGDVPGARADLVRVLDRRPDTLTAAEDLANQYLEAGDPDRALEVVRSLVRADPDGAQSRRVRQLRQRTEIKLVRRARAAADLVPLAQSPEPDTRKEVAWTAASFESADAEALLRSLLRDADEGVRRKAVQAFQRPWLVARLEEDGALLVVLGALLSTDPAPSVREAAAQAIGRVETAPAETALLARIAGPGRDAVASVRAAVCEALAGRESPAARRGFVLALADEDAVVRAAALRGLQRLTGDARGFEPDGPPDRRAAAIKAWEQWLLTGR